MARVTVEEVRAWGERTKLNIDVLDGYMLDQIETEILQRLQIQIDTSTWIDPATTPPLIHTIISRKYFAAVYFKAYSEDDGTTENTYANKLDASAEMLMAGILDGSIIVEGVTTDVTTISFYPTDASSAMKPTFDDPSLGPAFFSMSMKL